MKVCENCGVEIGGKDGENFCQVCEEAETKRQKANQRRRANRKAREEVMESLGLVKVRGNLGGTYWE